MRPLVVAYIAALPLIQAGLATLPIGKTLVLADVLFVVLVVAASLQRPSWRRPRVGLLAVAAGPPLAVLASALHAGGLGEPSVAELLRTAYSMLTLVVIASLPLNDDDRYAVSRAWVWTTGVVCLVGVFSWLAVVGLGLPENSLASANSGHLGPGFVRVSGVMHTNTLIVYLVLGSAFSAWLWKHGRAAAERNVGRAVLCLAAATAAISFSRGMLGLGVTLSLMAFHRCLAPDALWVRRRSILLGTSGLALAVTAMTLWAVWPLSNEQSSAGQNTLRPTLKPTGYRVLHRAGLRMLAANPLAGVGPGRFGTQLSKFTSAEERVGSWPTLGEVAWESHSAWIGFAAEGGVVLVGAWSLLTTWLLRALLRKDQPSVAGYVAMSFIGVAVYGLHINFEHLKFVWAAIGFALNDAIDNR